VSSVIDACARGAVDPAKAATAALGCAQEHAAHPGEAVGHPHTATIAKVAAVA
jgi:hypothetical protein